MTALVTPTALLLPPGPTVITLAPRERWCTACGESVPRIWDACPRSDGTDLVNPRLYLRPEEYRLAT